MGDNFTTKVEINCISNNKFMFFLTNLKELV